MTPPPTGSVGRTAGQVSRLRDPAPLADTGVMAILRSRDAAHLHSAAAVLVDSGIRCLEITLTVPDAMANLRRLRAELPPEVSLGAGTVTDPAQAVRSVQAGAQFLVTPTTEATIASRAAEMATPCYIGAYSPTEVLGAWRAGATAVKVFPASVGGPGYIRDLRGPLPQIRLLPTGGVSLENAGEYIHAGAVAVGVGGPLLRDALDGGDLRALSERAHRLLSNVAEAKEVA